MRFGSQLGIDISFRTSNGRVFYGKYKSSKSAIYGLQNLISVYNVYHNCLILFEYVGHSEFNVSIFDSQNMDHLKDVTGEYIEDIVTDLQNNEEASVIQGSEETEPLNVAEVTMLEAPSDQHFINETEGTLL